MYDPSLDLAVQAGIVYFLEVLILAGGPLVMLLWLFGLLRNVEPYKGKGNE